MEDFSGQAKLTTKPRWTNRDILVFMPAPRLYGELCPLADIPGIGKLPGSVPGHPLPVSGKNGQGEVNSLETTCGPLTPVLALDLSPASHFGHGDHSNALGHRNFPKVDCLNFTASLSKFIGSRFFMLSTLL